MAHGTREHLVGWMGLCLLVFGPWSRVSGQTNDTHWAFLPLPPADRQPANHTQLACNPIDDLIHQTLRANGLEMSPAADRQTLLRRATLDLTGLPPTAQEIAAFLADASPDAFERVVDRLLSSPHYGERWGRHWLDLVRYADTAGNSGDFPVPTAWLYRNYVIESFDSDRPYDRFVHEQLAGDLLTSTSEAARHEQIIATGYLAISRRFGVDEKEFHQTIEDTITNIGQAFLGLSIHCARCHDHMFEPVTNEDYYALYGIFASARYAFPGTEVFQSPKDFVPLVSDQMLVEIIQPFEEQVRAQDDEIERLRQLTLTRSEGTQRDQAVAEYELAKLHRVALLKNGPAYLKAYAVSEASPVDVNVHLKGNPVDLGDVVPRRFLSVFGGEPVSHAEETSGRLDLARWLTSPRLRPLTARVMANRVWQHHFGKGLVTTTNDFGVMGAPPSHPELLDYLAGQLIEGGWSLKKLHRRMMLTQTYRQASHGPSCPERFAYHQQTDPENKLLWRFPRRRLSAEELRDTLLALSGELDLARGRGHAFPPEHEWKFGQHTPYMGHLTSRHRSVFQMRQRLREDPYLAAFDVADANVTTDQRAESTTPLQALWLMNNQNFHAWCAAFARRLLASERDSSQIVSETYQLVFGRPANPVEIERAIGYVRALAQNEPSDDSASPADNRSAWASFLRVLLSSNEFLYVD